MGGKRMAALAVACGLVLIATACMHEVAPSGPQASFAGGQIVVNDAGVMAGMTTTGPSGMPHAFVKFGDAPIQLIDGGTPFASSVAAINKDNVVAGTIGATKPGETPSSGHPFLWSPGGDGLQELDLPPGMVGAAAVDINAGGTILVAGYPDYWAERSQPFLWDPTTTAYTPIPVRDLYVDRPAAINDEGVLVGQASFRSGESQQAAYWDATTTHAPHELDDGGAIVSYATDISTSGKVSGAAYNPSTGERVAYWSDVTAKPQLFEGEVASAVNDNGLMAGYLKLPPSDGYRLTAVLWDTTKGTTVRLGDYSSGGSQAQDVNLAGVAVGVAGDGKGKANVVRWDAYKPEG
jgi:hypothetical protein